MVNIQNNSYKLFRQLGNRIQNDVIYDSMAPWKYKNKTSKKYRQCFREVSQSVMLSHFCSGLNDQCRCLQLPSSIRLSPVRLDVYKQQKRTGKTETPADMERITPLHDTACQVSSHHKGKRPLL